MALPRVGGIPSHVRPSSGRVTSYGASAGTTSQASALQTRIREKKAELESLRQLRDLAAGLAGQMEQLERKLATLSDGTEAVAAVLANWHSVLRAIHMASAHLPVDKDGEDKSAEDKSSLPQTLVRIPIQHAEAMQREQDADEGGRASETTGD